MKKKIIIALLVVLVNVIVVIAVIHKREQIQEEGRKVIRDANRYDGATGPVVTAFDERTNRWIAELKSETIEEILAKLTDAAEFELGIILNSDGFMSFINEEWREHSYYQVVAKAILSNRRFRAALEGLQKIDKSRASQLLNQNIRENLAVLHTMLQEDTAKVAKNEHKDTGVAVVTHISTSSDDAYRPMAPPGTIPTRTGRKYAICSYLLLASLLELQDTRPAIEEVIVLAKKEYELFNSIDAEEASNFVSPLLKQSVYNPSILITAAFCDPNWNSAQKKRLPKEKLVHREVVDFQARALEQDKLASDGLVPVVPHDKMLKIRYYKGITDEEFNAFFAGGE